VRGGVITAVGTDAVVRRLAGGATRAIDLKGATVMPGLHDMHVHVLFAGLEQYACGFRPGATPQEIADAVRGCANGKPGGEWISGGNWVAAVFAPGQQNKSFLDAVAPNSPVVLSDESHHSSWVNSRALDLAGITRDTPNPPGGIIERDAQGEPTGLLRETAMGLVSRIVPPPDEAAKREALRLATAQMLSYGITSFTDAGINAENVATMSELSRTGDLKQRVRGCIRWPAAPQAANDAAESLLAARVRYATPRFRLDCVKVVLDGVPTESHTAAMLAPYTGGSSGDDHSDGRDRGILMIPQPVLNEAITRFDQAGLLVKFHAAGDAAVRSAIDAVAVARRANGPGGPMHDVAHNSFVDPADVMRVKNLHMTWEFSPYIWYPTPIAADDIRAAVGDARMQRWIPVRDAVASGALVVAGSDWSVVPSVNPWLAIETLVTRQRPGGSRETLGEGQRISLEEALRIFTENGALQMGHRHEVGSLEAGMRADLVVTEQNPFKIPITRVHATKVRMTFIDGELVFDAARPPRLKAR
jgi:predicted amidohydrolase YtcJ